MPRAPHKDLHALQDLHLQIRPAVVLAREAAIRGFEIERLQRFPHGVDFVGRERYHVGVRPHEAVACGAGETGGVVVCGLWVGQVLALTLLLHPIRTYRVGVEIYVPAHS